jgi:hypothetical protein
LRRNFLSTATMGSPWYGGAHVDGIDAKMLREGYEPFTMSDAEAGGRKILFDHPCDRYSKNLPSPCTVVSPAPSVVDVPRITAPHASS